MISLPIRYDAASESLGGGLGQQMQFENRIESGAILSPSSAAQRSSSLILPASPLARSSQRKLPTIGFLSPITIFRNEQMPGCDLFAAAWASSVGSRVVRSRSSIDWRGTRTRPRSARPRHQLLRVKLPRHRRQRRTGHLSSALENRQRPVIPIVFALAQDPVGNGLVASLARPRGNVTGSVGPVRPTLRESELSSCGRSIPVCAGWRRLANANDPGFIKLETGRGSGRGPHPWYRRLRCSKFGEPKVIAPAWRSL